jgi:hypothetical protein
MPVGAGALLIEARADSVARHRLSAFFIVRDMRIGLAFVTAAMCAKKKPRDRLPTRKSSGLRKWLGLAQRHMQSASRDPVNAPCISRVLLLQPKAFRAKNKSRTSSQEWNLKLEIAFLQK